MRHRHNTAIINDIVIEQNIAEFDYRWIGRGALNSESRIWVMNIPKNGSNSIGRLIAPGNRPRDNWQTELLLKDHSEPNDSFIVVLRNPVERFAGSLAQHFVIRLEHGHTLSEIHADIDTLSWCDGYFDDMHIWPQFTYLHGVNTKNTTFLEIDQLAEIPDMVGITDDIERWNVSDDNEALKVTKARVKAIIQSNPEAQEHIAEYYKSDYELIEQYLGKIPDR